MIILKKFSQIPITTPKIALCIEYDGSQFYGWQIQRKPPVITVQGELEKALAFVANREVKVYCAGRTDARVHATNQVVHFENDVARSEQAWIRGVNARLPDNIAVKWAVGVDEPFHARFSAQTRTYHYIIHNTDIRSPILHNKVTLVYEKLDAGRMHQAAQALLGEHDFSGYRAAGCQSHSSHRRMDVINVVRQGDFIVTTLTANAFLLHMVRNIMGTLIDIGSEKKKVDWAKEVLEAKDRTLASKTAPACGLYLTQVAYDESFKLPAPPFSFMVDLG